MVDKGMVDKGMVDKGMVDKGMVDKGMVDKGMVDKGMVDKGMVGKGMVGKGMVGKGMVGKGMVGKGMEHPTLPSYSCVPNSFVQYLTGERLVPGAAKIFRPSRIFRWGGGPVSAKSHRSMSRGGPGRHLPRLSKAAAAAVSPQFGFALLQSFFQTRQAPGGA
jgi:hypothetical protein